MRASSSLYPKTDSIGEVSDPDSTITSFFEGGRPRFDDVDSRLTTVFDFPMYYALRDVLLRGQPVQKIVDVLQRDSLYERPDLLVTFFGNHDMKRFMGELGASKEKAQERVFPPANHARRAATLRRRRNRHARR